MRQSVEDLWSECARLTDGIPDIREDMLELGPAVIALLAEQRDACDLDRTRAIYQGAIDDHTRFIDLMGHLVHESDGQLARYRLDRYIARIEEIMARVQGVSPSRIADEFLTLFAQPWDEVQLMPERISVPLASTAIGRYSLTYAHRDTLAAFLGRPTRGQQMFDGALQLAKAVALDVGGSTIFPFVGVLQTVFELATPHLERERERMDKARSELERLFFFGDQVAALGVSAGLARSSAEEADRFIGKVITGFEDNLGYLNELLDS
jgi:hypothetical protein